MAITWGGWATIGPVRLRAGVENTVSPSNPGPSTSSVTVTTRIYLGVDTTGWGNGTWSAGDDASGSGSFSWNLSKGQSVLVGTVTKTVSLIYGRTQSFKGRGTVRPFTTYTGTVTAAQTVTIPARPISPPAGFSSPTVTRANDTRQNLSWSMSPTDARPITGVRVTRSVNFGSFITVANLSGSARSWADTSTSAGNIYRYNVVAQNSAGETVGLPGNVPVSTTPLRPGAPSAVKNAAGDIIVSRPALSASATSWSVAESGGATLVASIPASQSTWVHTNPDTSKTWRYVIQARSSTPTLTSAWSPASNIVQLLAPPNPPTNLAPNGSVRDATTIIAVSWRHSPVDTTGQTHYEVRWRVAGTSTWNSSESTQSSSSLHTFPADTWDNGQTVEWQVRTWGQYPTPSEWSATARVILSSQPLVTINLPAAGETVDAPSYLFGWSFFQAEGLRQSAWQTELIRNGQVVRSGSGGGATETWRVPAILENGGTYTFRVRVADSTGHWSAWSSRTFSVAFTPPMQPDVEGRWFEEGYVRLDLTAVSDVNAPETTSFNIERSINGGEWVTLVSGYPINSEFLDWTATSNGRNTYRVHAVSDLPSTSHVDIEVVADNDCYLYLGGGPGHAVVARLKVVTTRTLQTGRQRVLNQYAGRESPVETSGIALPWEMSVTATLVPSGMCNVRQSDVEELLRVFGYPGPHLMRDGDGRYEWVSLSIPDVNLGYLGEATFTMTRSSPATDEQLAAIAQYMGPALVQVRPGEYKIIGGTTETVDEGEWEWTP